LQHGLNHVTFESANGLLRGAFHRPSGNGPFPVVIFFHGFTGTRVEPHRIFVKMSRMLEAEGIASLRFDFYGNGESDGDFEQVTVKGELKDAFAAREFLKGVDCVNQDNLAILGFSLGGMVGALYAGQYGSFRGACLWAPVADAHPLWMSGLTSTALKSLERRGWVDKSGSKVSRKFIEGLKGLDPVSSLAEAGTPVIVVHGAQDTAVPVKHGKAYCSACENSEYFEIAQSDHCFNSVAAENRALEKSLKWLKAILL